MHLRAKCPACGEVDITAADLTVVECVNAPHLSTRILYCPECEAPTQRPVDRLTSELLRKLGVQVRLWKVPAEILEPHAGPAISEADVARAESLPAAQVWAAYESAARAAGERAA